MSPNGLLLYVPGSNGVDFIKMEIIDLKVKMEWNLGSGIGVIQTQDIFIGKCCFYNFRWMNG